MQRLLNRELNKEVIDLRKTFSLLVQGMIILCREAEDAEDIAGQSNCAEDDHGDPDNPEPDKCKEKIANH